MQIAAPPQGHSIGAGDGTVTGMGAMSEQSIEVFRPELHAWVYKAVLEVADKDLGEGGTDALLKDFGLLRGQLLDHEAWVSLEFTEVFFDELMKRTGDPDLF